MWIEHVLRDLVRTDSGYKEASISKMYPCVYPTHPAPENVFIAYRCLGSAWEEMWTLLTADLDSEGGRETGLDVERDDELNPEATTSRSGV